MSKRTTEQFNAIHVYCDLVAEALNDAGFDRKAVLAAKSLPVANTKEFIKEIWKAAQEAMYPPEEGKRVSTNDINIDQVSNVYDVMNRWLGENFEIHVPFPTKEEK